MQTPYMMLDLPDVSSTTGPQWATDLNTAMSVVDAHDHTSGSGTRVPVAGLNINADLSFSSFNATTLRSVRMNNNSVALSSGTDLSCIFVAGGEFYYRDASGNSIQITASGALNAASIGAIGGDYATSTASLSYSNTTKKFTFTQSANTAALIDCGPITLRKSTASSNGIILQPAAGIAADYTLTLPSAVPGALSIFQVDSSGNASFSNVIKSITAATSAEDVGSTGAPFRALYVDNGATDSGAIFFNAGTSAFLKGNAAGTTLSTGGFTDFDHTSVKAAYNSNAGTSYGTGPSIVNYEDSVFDSHSAVTTGASWKFTAPIAGLYFVTADVSFSSASYTVSQSVTLSVYKNGTLYARLGAIEAGSSTAFSLYAGGAALVSLAASDFIDVRVTNARGSTALTSTPENNHIEIIKLSQ